MIDKKSGAIFFKSLNSFISPSLSLNSFLSSPIGKGAQLFIKNQEYVSYKVVKQEFKGKEFIPLFYFKDEDLIEIQLHNFTETSYWSEVDDSVLMKIKCENDLLLNTILGHQPLKFSWGEVISLVDKKAGTVGIIVRYKSPV